MPSSVNTSAAVIVRDSSHSSPEITTIGHGDDKGRPETGKDYYINKGIEECESSLSSLSFGSLHYDIEKGGRNKEVGEDDHNIEMGVEVPIAFENTNTDAASSLSSLTNDIARKRKSRFGLFGGLGKFQVTTLPYSYYTDTADMNMNHPQRQYHEASNGSPWYSVETKSIANQNSSAAMSHQSNNDASSNSTSPEVTVNTPEKELITSKKHLEELVRFPPPPPPPAPASLKPSTRRVSDLDTSRQSQFCTSDNNTTGGRSEGFATYVYDLYSSSRRRLAVLFVLILFLVCILAITVAALSVQQGGTSSSSGGVASAPAEQPFAENGDTIPYEALLNTESNTASSEVPSQEDQNEEDGPKLESPVPPTIVNGDDSLFTSVDEEVMPNSVTETASSAVPSTVQIQESLGTESTSASDTAANNLSTETSETTGKEVSSDTLSTEEGLSSTESSSSEPPQSVSTTQTVPSTTQAQTTVLTTQAQSTTTTTTATTTLTDTTSSSSESTSVSAPIRDPSTLILKPIVDTTVFKNRPTNTYEDQPYLVVKGLNKASSFLRFDLTTIPGKYVARATLRLYSLLPHGDDFNEVNDESGRLSSVRVDMLRGAGKWDASLITWNNPVQSTESLNVAAFSVEGYPYSETSAIQQINAVDVTRAFQQHLPFLIETVTVLSFKIYSDEDTTGRVDFASSESHFEPELIIELSDTQSPTPLITTSPSTTSSTTPSTAPSLTSSTTSVISTPAPAPQSECENKCDNNIDKKYTQELGFETIEEWIDNCKVVTPDCSNDNKKCEKECQKQAEEVELTVQEKVDKHVIKCKAKCTDTSEWGAKSEDLAVERHDTKAHKDAFHSM